jgi:hypothetical protein
VKEVISARVTRLISGLLDKSEKKGATIQESVEALEYNCPVCKKAWPKKSKETKENVAVRIDPKVAGKLSKLQNMSAYILAALNVKMGACPLCEQKR